MPPRATVPTVEPVLDRTGVRRPDRAVWPSAAHRSFGFSGVFLEEVAGDAGTKGL